MCVRVLPRLGFRFGLGFALGVRVCLCFILIFRAVFGRSFCRCHPSTFRGTFCRPNHMRTLFVGIRAARWTNIFRWWWRDIISCTIVFAHLYVHALAYALSVWQRHIAITVINIIIVVFPHLPKAQCLASAKCLAGCGKNIKRSRAEEASTIVWKCHHIQRTSQPVPVVSAEKGKNRCFYFIIVAYIHEIFHFLKWRWCLTV